MNDYKNIEKKLVTFIKEELKKIGLKNVIIGLSGGLDSSVTAVLLKKALGKNVYGLMLPSSTSNKIHLTHAKALCERFDIDYEIIPIGGLVDSYFKDKDATPLRKGNFSARMRMSVLYDISAKKEAIVIGTSNKSEIALGYGTVCGDLACAINPIGEIYKSDLFKFAKYLGVNEEIISKAPSADLWEGQTDEEELGFSYGTIDEILRDFLDKGLDEQELLNKGYEDKLVKMIVNRYYQNQFKGRLPIIAEL